VIQQLPILYSFRRCPYAMRARLALYVSGQVCIHREVVLRDKPPEMLLISPKATVPVLQLTGADGQVLDQSLDIMRWALGQHDPQHWLRPTTGTAGDMESLIARCEAEFKYHLDRYKYANRFAGADPLVHRTAGEQFLDVLQQRLSTMPHLFGQNRSLADVAIAPFVRQFAHTDLNWFEQAPYPDIRRWLLTVTGSPMFQAIMQKYPRWQAGDPPTRSPIATFGPSLPLPPAANP